jgi:hypothetical protein
MLGGCLSRAGGAGSEPRSSGRGGCCSYVQGVEPMLDRLQPFHQLLPELVVHPVRIRSRQ